MSERGQAHRQGEDPGEDPATQMASRSDAVHEWECNGDS